MFLRVSSAVSGSDDRGDTTRARLLFEGCKTTTTEVIFSGKWADVLNFVRQEDVITFAYRDTSAGESDGSHPLVRVGDPEKDLDVVVHRLFPEKRVVMFTHAAGGEVQSLTQHGAEQFYPVWTPSSIPFQDATAHTTDHSKGTDSRERQTVNPVCASREFRPASRQDLAAPASEATTESGGVSRRSTLRQEPEPFFDISWVESSSIDGSVLSLAADRSCVPADDGPGQRALNESQSKEARAKAYAQSVESDVLSDVLNPEILKFCADVEQGTPSVRFHPSASWEASASAPPTDGGTRRVSKSSEPGLQGESRAESVISSSYGRLWEGGDLRNAYLRPVRSRSGVQLSKEANLRPPSARAGCPTQMLLSAEGGWDGPTDRHPVAGGGPVDPRRRMQNARLSPPYTDCQPSTPVHQQDIPTGRGRRHPANVLCTDPAQPLPPDTPASAGPEFSYSFPGKARALFYPEIYPDRVEVTDEFPDLAGPTHVGMPFPSAPPQMTLSPTALSMTWARSNAVLEAPVRHSLVWPVAAQGLSTPLAATPLHGPIYPVVSHPQSRSQLRPYHSYSMFQPAVARPNVYQSARLRPVNDMHDILTS
ncbi:hypothetical protein BESB_038250 [Besnoitia besnoiti]|uniref:Uncharacterized protein n=1 Tax=Besnoitia besnoiti TaxID=94643 RepID=A0A2A9MND7_BESBE|nr:hypothetical protein BESB_038250 [Besnoitia besnoiti]PFH37367.1 hypothetical protein BESB_038250 [Besnoitia besnoiti]